MGIKLNGQQRALGDPLTSYTNSFSVDGLPFLRELESSLHFRGDHIFSFSILDTNVEEVLKVSGAPHLLARKGIVNWRNEKLQLDYSPICGQGDEVFINADQKFAILLVFLQ